ncbi:MAG: right-handed parallel beta-helix repeat-containing protein [Planctomycetes bacterium]|nr:right-handed parallel beta-helix repeat-containing protein [Planctomycetota bacterium]
MLKSLRLEDTQSQGVFIGSSSYVTVRQCALKNMAQEGIRINGSTGVLIDKCSITAPGTEGLRLTSSNGCVATKNKIKNTVEEGIQADGDMHTFEANTITAPGAEGILLGNGVTGCLNALVSGNKITKSGNDGISCLADAQQCTILENDVDDPENEGINTADGPGGHFISKNKLRSTGDHSIVIESDGCTIHKNSIATSAEDGIRIATECSGALVIKNTITKCLENGITVRGTGNTFVGNKASKSGLFDLDDDTLPGENTYINNKFGTIAP